MTADLQARAFLLAKAYEQVRKKKQFGYKLFGHKLDEETKSLPLFKQFVTLADWLLSQGWHLSWTEMHWQGYLSFAFSEFSPAVPLPGQLKNPVLLKKYLQSLPDKEQECKETSDLENLYARVVLPEISKDKKLMRSLGLRDIACL